MDNDMSSMALHHTVNVTQQNMVSLAQMFAQAMQLMVASSQQSNAMIVDALGQLVASMRESRARTLQSLVAIADHADSRMETLAGHFAEGQRSIMGVMNRKRRVVRGPDGSVEGVE